MGSVFSNCYLSEEEIDFLLENTIFTESQILDLHARFYFLNRTRTGHLTYSDLLHIPEFQSNPLVLLLLNSLEDETENLDFINFVKKMEIFHSNTNKQRRVQFLFKILDLNNDGKICKNVLLRLIKMMKGKHYNYDEDIENVNDVFMYYDMENKGYLALNDFVKFYDDCGYETKMIIDFNGNKEEKYLHL